MADITLSKAVRSNLLNLQSTATQLGKTQEKLATGLKVNSALDNPTNFFTASSLNSRAGDLGQLLDSVSNAVQTIDAADKGISAITKLVESAQATARQALQTAATVDSTAAASAGTVAGGTFANLNVSGAGSAATASTVTAASTFTDIDLSANADNALTFDVDLGGTTANITLDRAGSGAGGAGVDNTYDIDEAILEIQAQIDASAIGAGAVTVSKDVAGTSLVFTNVTAGATALTVDNVAATGTTPSQAITDLGISDPGTTGQTDTGSATVAADALTFALSVDGTAVSGGISITDAVVDTYNTANTTTLDSSALTADDIVLLINDQAGASVASVNATSGGIDFTSTTTGATSSVTIGAPAVTGSASNTTGLAAGTNTGSDSTTTSIANPQREVLRAQYNDLLTQIDQLAADTSFNGVNLLNGDSLSVLFNEDGTSSLDVTGVTFNAAGLGLDELASGAFDSNADINSTLDDLKTGIDSLRSQASTFGSNLSVVETRQDFTKNIINVLETGAANLTLADSNEEAANLLALQTRQQLSSTALSLASQADQNVLRLF